MKHTPDDERTAWLSSIIEQDFSEEELKELDSLLHEVREEIWLEQQGVQKSIIVNAEPARS